jgi:hypothetical protein
VPCQKDLVPLFLKKKGQNSPRALNFFFTCLQNSLEKEKGGFVISNSAKKKLKIKTFLSVFADA